MAVEKPPQLPNISTQEHHPSFLFSPLETSVPAKCTSTVDITSMPLSMPSSMLGDFGSKSFQSVDYCSVPKEPSSGFSMNLLQDMQRNVDGGGGELHAHTLMKNPLTNEQTLAESVVHSIGFPISLPLNNDAWKPDLVWDSSPCPSEMSTSFSTTKSYA